MIIFATIGVKIVIILPNNTLHKSNQRKESGIYSLRKCILSGKILNVSPGTTNTLINFQQKFF